MSNSQIKITRITKDKNYLSTEKARLFWIETNQYTKTSTFFGHESL